jgi:hypothetical protein
MSSTESTESTESTAALYYTKAELFIEQAPGFNFELSADELVVKGLAVGFITKVGDDLYKRNESYKSKFD